MPQREFDITIGKDGSVELQIKGYKGRACLEAAGCLKRLSVKRNPRATPASFMSRKNRCGAIWIKATVHDSSQNFIIRAAPMSEVRFWRGPMPSAAG